MVKKLNFILDEIYFTLSDMKRFSEELDGEKRAGYNLALYDLEELKKSIIKRFKQYDIDINMETRTLQVENLKRTPIPKGLRLEVFNKDNNKCVICGCKEKLHVDHKIPISRGGTDSLANLQTLCEACNLDKGNRIIKNEQMY